MSKTILTEKTSPEHSASTLKIAVEGCGHGSLDTIYSSLEQACDSRGWSVAELDILIICGDFQAVRNEGDLNCMSVPRKYRNIGDFHRYYCGDQEAPVLTIVIGGNHEASNYFAELHHGGWLAPNIYYLGATNVLRYGPLRIAGISGIFNRASYHTPHHECLPYDRSEIRSVYHVRECDVSRLLQLRSPVDVVLSHDWPRRVEWFGNYAKLFEERPSFWESAKVDNLGSAPAEKVMYHLRPRHWFSGHMHIKYSAIVEHKGNMDGDIFKNLGVSDKVKAQLPKSMFKTASRRKTSAQKSSAQKLTNAVTHFLALDKPGPHRDFLELLEVDACYMTGGSPTDAHMRKSHNGKYALHYDEEWLAIVRSSSRLLVESEAFLEEGSVSATTSTTPQNMRWVQTNITAKGLLKVPENFERHAPVHDPNDRTMAKEQPCEFPNSQTECFCEMLQISNMARNSIDVAEVDDSIVFE